MKPQTLTPENFQKEVLDSDVPVLVDFWASWCGPCNALAPVLEDLAVEFDGKAKVAKVNVDDYQGLTNQYGVRALPTLILFKQGEVVDTLVGSHPKGVLSKRLTNAV